MGNIFSYDGDAFLRFESLCLAFRRILDRLRRHKSKSYEGDNEISQPKKQADSGIPRQVHFNPTVITNHFEPADSFLINSEEYNSSTEEFNEFGELSICLDIDANFIRRETSVDWSDLD